MNTRTKLKICDWSLLALWAATLTTSAQLEATGGTSAAWVWAHILICTLFLAFVIYHLYLHFRWTGWGARLFGKRRGAMKWLTVFGLLVALSAIAATLHWTASMTHSVIGAIHGKIGFVFLMLTGAHAIRHRKFYR